VDDELIDQDFAGRSGAFMGRIRNFLRPLTLREFGHADTHTVCTIGDIGL
jgi:hypothetical protein